MIILYDGWPLAYEPNSPAAIHLLALLEHHPSGVQALLGLPGQSFHPLPEKVRSQIQPTPNREAARLRWEQRSLPRLADDLDADLVHLTSGAPALFGASRSVVSPTVFVTGSDLSDPLERSAGMAARLRASLFQGGLARARGILWPTDLPEPALNIPIHRLPPAIPASFGEQVGKTGVAQAALDAISLGKQSSFNALEAYILYHGPLAEADLRRLLDAWNWAAGPVGESYPLLLVGMNDAAEARLRLLLDEYELESTVRFLPALPLDTLAALYRGCSALFHPAGVAHWGGSLRLALASARPIVGLESFLANALLGPAAYLIRPDGTAPEISRALGGALVTVIVEESVAEALSQAAHERTAAWKTISFSQSLGDAYQAFSSLA